MTDCTKEISDKSGKIIFIFLGLIILGIPFKASGQCTPSTGCVSTQPLLYVNTPSNIQVGVSYENNNVDPFKDSDALKLPSNLVSPKNQINVNQWSNSFGLWKSGSDGVPCLVNASNPVDTVSAPCSGSP